MALNVEISPSELSLEDEDGNALSFEAEDWTDGVWERKVQASPIGDESEVVVKVTSDKPNEDGTTETVYGRITLDREVRGVWDSGAVTGKVGEDIAVGWRITDRNGMALPRVPAGLASVSYDFTRSDGEAEADGDVTIEWDSQGAYDRGAGTVRVMSPGTLRLSLLTTGSDDDYCVVEVSGIEHPSLANLCEAIKERYEYIKQSELSLDKTSPLSTIRARAVDSVQGYLKSYDLETNTVAEYGSSDASSMFPPVPTSEDEIDAWVSTCYKEIVKVRRWMSSISSYDKILRQGEGYASRAYEWDRENEVCRWTESESSAKGSAKENMDSDLSTSSTSESIVCKKASQYVDIEPGAYWPGQISCSYKCVKFKLTSSGKSSFNPGGETRFSVKSKKYGERFKKWGCPVPDCDKYGYVGGTVSFGTDGKSITEYVYDFIGTGISWDHYNPDDDTYSGSFSGGFELEMGKAIFSMRFKH